MRTRLLAVFALTLGPTSAWASQDIRLNATRQNGQGILFSCAIEPCQPDNEGFKDLMTELAFIVAPRIAGPAETLGHAGFGISLGYSGSTTSGDDIWRTTESGQERQRATDFLHVLRLDARKGLPFSFEVGAHVQWVLDSEMVAPGLDLTWSFQEGYDFLPDFALRAGVNTLLGPRDFDLTTLSLDFVFSKNFAVGGAAQLAPYFGWSVLMINANSEVVDPTPAAFVPAGAGQGLRPDTENDIVFDALRMGDDVNNRVTLGVRALFSVVQVGVQGELQVFSNGEAVGPVGTVSARLGFEY